MSYIFYKLQKKTTTNKKNKNTFGTVELGMQHDSIFNNLQKYTFKKHTDLVIIIKVI